MAEGHVAHRAAALPWLAPSAPNLAALAETSQAGLSDDPASVLLLLRFTRPTPTVETITLADAAFQNTSILEAAATYLESRTDGWCDPTHSEVARLLIVSRSIAEKAESLAAISGTCTPTAARVAGLLAPLGWLAVATVEPELIAACRLHDDFDGSPSETESHVWGLSADAIARRLVNRWRLPAWLANTLSTLRLPVNDAIKLGADAGLTRVLRFAIEATQNGMFLGLTGSRTATGSEQLVESTVVEEQPVQGLDASTDPRTIPLLPALLRTATQARRNSGQSRVAQLESQIDVLQSALQAARDDFEVSLRDAKLKAVAELAAGAGHEINNPLAVISGNAQLLRIGEEDAERRRSLDVIVRQATRVAELLQDLMQFARPAKAQPTTTSVVDLLASVERETSPIAIMKSVTLRVMPGEAIRIRTDVHQARKALGNLVRNALEATPTDGVIRVLSRVRNGAIELIVEDSGPGPTAESLPHLFDPFYSGRSAGRGRGLGLSTAWQYARQNGGDLRFERSTSGPTRFVLTLPLAEAALERQSA